MQTVTISVQTAKGRTQDMVWGIYQQRPYPSIAARGGDGAQWHGGDGIFSEYGRPPAGLADKYRAVLLREGYTPETATNTRNDYAGFAPYLAGGGQSDPLPGALVYRGRSLGETEADIDTRPHGTGVWFKVRTRETPTATEKALLNEQVAPALLEAIQQHAAALRTEAIDGIRASCESNIRDARARLDKLESEADTAIAAL